MLLRQFSPKAVYGSDINDKTALVAAWNVALNIPPEQAQKYTAVLGSWNLADWLQSQGRIDVFIGCLPQAPLPKGVDITKGNHYGDYYDPEKFTDGALPEKRAFAKKMNELGLGLNNSALATFNKKMNMGGDVILNFGGRPGVENLMHLFEENGFRPEILHEAVVEQDPKTDITPFVDREKHMQESQPNFSFEFYSDPEGQTRVTAAEAYQRRDTDKERIYHKIYVIGGTKVSELDDH